MTHGEWQPRSRSGARPRRAALPSAASRWCDSDRRTSRPYTPKFDRVSTSSHAVNGRCGLVRSTGGRSAGAVASSPPHHAPPHHHIAPPHHNAAPRRATPRAGTPAPVPDHPLRSGFTIPALKPVALAVSLLDAVAKCKHPEGAVGPALDAGRGTYADSDRESWPGRS